MNAKELGRRGPIVAGYDGSPASMNAVEWAAREAAARKLPLLIVHAAARPAMPGMPTAIPAGWDTRAADDSWRTVLAVAADRAASIAPGIQISTVLLHSRPAKALVAESDGAEMVVVGSSGRGEVASVLLGSTALPVAAHAPCPAVVVPRVVRSGPVVVGLDSGPAEAGDPAFGDVLDFAFDFASRRGVPLIGVRVWGSPLSGFAPDLSFPMDIDWEALKARQQVIASELLAGWEDKYPDVSVQQVVPYGRPAAELVKAARDAQLLVVGSHGHGAIASLFLGSVSRDVLHHAPCPVAVLRTGPRVG